MTQCVFRDAAPHECEGSMGTPETGGTWKTSWEVMGGVGRPRLTCGSVSQGSKEGQHYV